MKTTDSALLHACSYSAIAVAKAGNAISQATRLNLGKFRGSRASDLNKMLRSKFDLSSSEVRFEASTRDLRSNREVRNSIKMILLTT